jgi:hypothetical protein
VIFLNSCYYKDIQFKNFIKYEVKIKFLTLLILCSSLHLFAQNMHYPELEVTPRASERIRLEIKNEKTQALTSSLPMMISGLMTFTAGVISSSSLNDDKPEGDKAPMIAMGVGALWLGIGAWSAFKYRPYGQFFKKLRKMPYKSKRQKLTSERIAEEELNQLARMGRNIRWFSVATNMLASGFLLENIEGESDAQIVGGISILTSLLPLFFSSHWERIACEQKKYKKKIYAPIAMTPIFKKTVNGDYASGLSLAYKF